MIPDYDVVVIDEAHELAARVTQAATDELPPRRRRPGGAALATVRRGLPRPTTWPTRARPLRDAIGGARPGRFDRLPKQLARRPGAGARRRPRVPLGVPQVLRTPDEADAGRDPGAGVGAGDLHRPPSGWPPLREADVLWLAEGGDRFPPRLCVAPLQVWGAMRESCSRDKTGRAHLRRP